MSFPTLPKIPGLRCCSECEGRLFRNDFWSFGIICNDPAVIFLDYKCRHCQFGGRWTVTPVDSDGTPLQALKMLVDILEYGKDERGIVLEKLNKIHGVSDLFKLGGKNAPRERRARKR